MGRCYAAMGRSTRGLKHFPLGSLTMNTDKGLPFILKKKKRPKSNLHLNTDIGYVWPKLAWSATTFLPSVLETNVLQQAVTQQQESGF